MNINFCNSFNENYDITISYEPFYVYDFGLLANGVVEAGEYMKDIGNNEDVYLDSGHTQQVEVERVNDLTMGASWASIVERFKVLVTPTPYSFSLQQQSINSLLQALNYPLQHIPYQSTRVVKQNDGNMYKTTCSGEIDVSNQIFWDTYNGKLRFNYNGVDYNNISVVELFESLFADGIGMWPVQNQSLNYRQKAGTYSYDYIASFVNTQDPLSVFASNTENDIFVVQNDNQTNNKIFTMNNAYFANQLLGFIQTPQTIFDVLYNNSSVTLYPQQRYDTYHVELYVQGDNNYLKNASLDFYLTETGPHEGMYNLNYNRHPCLAREFFLQIWREVYVLSRELQTNNMIYKPENIVYNKRLQYTNTINKREQHYIDENKDDYTYYFDDNMNCIAYYVNSVSFNNYVSLQNTYPLQYNQYDEGFEIESLKNMRILLVDENGVILPRLSEFKVYLQVKADMDNQAQGKTTNFNRVIDN